MTSPSKSTEASTFPNRDMDSVSDAEIVAAGLKEELDMQAAFQRPPKERPSWCAGAICTKDNCQKFVNGHIQPPRTNSICNSCSYTGARNPDCWCGLCLECTPRPIGIGSASGISEPPIKS